ncbi:hypothetical protein [Diaphorobacter aerolatus]|uniref:Uncharacterized protein n=1 Tax=Diaphorobacter aerolatus TaxID=1288495 RepID=A0A7H0GLY7_9BURK|nr:hypothetical protein [Diaphorobacter aerolatus]QNP49303.1 hypothetical protein H9K75_04355 [Diaphorobacter aerolatus]
MTGGDDCYESVLAGSPLENENARCGAPGVCVGCFLANRFAREIFIQRSKTTLFPLPKTLALILNSIVSGN